MRENVSADVYKLYKSMQTSVLNATLLLPQIVAYKNSKMFCHLSTVFGPKDQIGRMPKL